MKIRFGYVSTAITLWDASPSKTLTFTRYQQLSKQERDGKVIGAHKIKSFSYVTNAVFQFGS